MSHFSDLEKLIRAHELRKRSFITEDYSLNYEIIFVCIHLTLYETLVRFRLPSWKITNSLSLARQFVGFFAKIDQQQHVPSHLTPSSASASAVSRPTSQQNTLNTDNAFIQPELKDTSSAHEPHSIFRSLREDMQKYGFFFICCFMHIYYPIGLPTTQITEAIEDFFVKRSESTSKMEETRLMGVRARKFTNWFSNSETSETGETSGVIQRAKLLTMAIPRCDWLTLTEDVCHVMDNFRQHVLSFSLYFSEPQYQTVTPLLNSLADSNLQALELIQLHSLGDFQLSRVCSVIFFLNL